MMATSNLRARAARSEALEHSSHAQTNECVPFSSPFSTYRLLESPSPNLTPTWPFPSGRGGILIGSGIASV